MQPKELETIFDWSRRVVNAEFEERLLSPALQGIFAGDPKRLSATLTLGALFKDRAPSGRLKGSVAPALGMNQLMQALRDRLTNDGVEFHFNHEFQMDDASTGDPVVICTSAWTAAAIIEKSHPQLSDDLRHCESLPLVSVTAIFEKSSLDLEGFGCLFPPSQGFQASGVIFNDCVFEGRSAKRSETWIFGGAQQLSACKWTDEEIQNYLLKDRAKLMPGATTQPLQVNITRWPRAIPHYTIQWEKFVNTMRIERPLYLHGNYLGALGLAKIHRRSQTLAEQLEDTYGA